MTVLRNDQLLQKSGDGCDNLIRNEASKLPKLKIYSKTIDWPCIIQYMPALDTVIHRGTVTISKNSPNITRNGTGWDGRGIVPV